MKNIIFSDLIHCQTIENPMKQQLFLLSRFFDMSEAEIGEMSIGKIRLMTEEMNKYFETYGPDFSKENAPVPDESIENRWEILDIRKDQ